ncbi:MAG: hypothetical protein AB1427_08995 [Thermodesulfobacteriota bacterium]
MDILRLYEEGFSKILLDHRDHYLHSASVYALGLAIYNGCSTIRNACNTDRHEADFRHEQKASFLFRWSLAACLHDLAYPLELSLKSFNRYSNYLNQIADDTRHTFISIDPRIYERFNLLPIIHPENNLMPMIRKDTALGLIASCLTDHTFRRSPVTFETLHDVLKRYLKNNLAIGRIDHGVFSSFIVLRKIHQLYLKNNWDIWNYYYEVVDAATAIFLHNSYAHSELKNIYRNGKFNYDYPSPLGYLLFLADSLCEWFRGNRRDYKVFGVHVDDRRITLRMPKKVIAKMAGSAELFDERIPVISTDKWDFVTD